MNKLKYVHTKILSKDWKKLAQFYIDVFDCKPLYPERDMHGDWIDDMTSIANVRIKGIHLELPGYENGPTLEIFSYNHPIDRNHRIQINEMGFTHIAFRADNVQEAVDKVIAYGGSFYGKIVETKIGNVGVLTAVYMQDPEGNIVEIQNWS
jgi:predicted enzyme related to lactoylglutathione lyase